MKQEELLEEIKEALQRDEEISLDMSLEDIEEWDSLAVISMISLYDQLFSIVITNDQLSDCNTVQDLINLVSDKVEI